MLEINCWENLIYLRKTNYKKLSKEDKAFVDMRIEQLKARGFILVESKYRFECKMSNRSVQALMDLLGCSREYAIEHKLQWDVKKPKRRKV